MTPERAPRDEEGTVGRWLLNDPDGWWECDGSAPACVRLHGPSIVACRACGTKRPPLPATPAPMTVTGTVTATIVNADDAQVVGKEVIAGVDDAYEAFRERVRWFYRHSGSPRVG